MENTTNIPTADQAMLDRIAKLETELANSPLNKTKRVLSKTWKGLCAGFKSFTQEQFAK